ncbi:G-protein alpha subunit-domain-containing protein [Gymnopilus junonius]|uniref:G-protein alpha subunit-domain-containing protein n=1 Tax=Gymnopilus junonius TaxID=109634 RepID=A0A9P5NI27_GYMJU|nr:G-protein alpha subunit-domain-containing protein [Gymnopilus junonius]
MKFRNSDDIFRISKPDYQPTDIDILHVDLRSVCLRRDPVERTAIEVPESIIFYDIDRSVDVMWTHVWTNYADTMLDHLIFHVSMSIFEESDPGSHQTKRRNDFNDSLSLWKSICGSRLRRSTVFIVFFTKVDLLQRQLNSGIYFTDHVPNYIKGGNRTDDILSFWRREYGNTAMATGYLSWQDIQFFNLSFNDLKSSLTSMERLKWDIPIRHIGVNVCVELQ